MRHITPTARTNEGVGYSRALVERAMQEGRHPQRILARQARYAKAKCKRKRAHESRRINAQRRK